MKTENKAKSKSKPRFKILNETHENPRKDRLEFCGAIHLKIDPIAYQTKMRNEWR